MPKLGVQMMMVKEAVAEEGMWPVLQRLHDLDLEGVEVSQIPTDETNVAALERGTRELGLAVGALSVAIEPIATASCDNLVTDFAKIVEDCQRLDCRYVRIGMMPVAAMTSKDACEEFARKCQAKAQELAPHGITLCYHNHHVDLAQLEGERIFDIVRRVAPSLGFEVDLHWVMRGGMNPLDMLKNYHGVCKLVHLKDFRVVPLTPEMAELPSQGKHREFAIEFNNLVRFSEVGAGNMNWPELLPAAKAAGADWFFIEQDETYGRDPFDCIKDSREYLRTIGY
ncbi:sugar phosphate isomerase/epimerase [Aestuariimicrobium sp. p3-SID1156]|uniref:sugar phosphate isomerase/epimerase family protein n=1 Tax=Aestuariimicrobium sp. p3-SID1156 TaxID=2916038 RepID=UPI00223B7BFD|nr:sugar phosphate isomerase/epimerase [Aestuariimicrobium sp. p3-SID1156]MCT1458825.1 sugar phosphate isomerase/epimerase [Aestuariimicrobium sp. p3-SID1156]